MSPFNLMSRERRNPLPIKSNNLFADFNTIWTLMHVIGVHSVIYFFNEHASLVLDVC